uniref:U4/U6 small nuclear ribonucleoprotein Prp3 putative n=1 Tax=Albugo laibachii Nc14 TaxID=890382 RepID=F0W5Y1_9STRA|nr:U4/U6 small nuclear ribonucleoprotein Prp3 putative [Albugo laibachii Nc14]|eukprot:CCA16522.1 U4/U6 small nuclear ribonucleoprotein Prp3 putative [Albugo laibachii Nc14]
MSAAMEAISNKRKRKSRFSDIDSDQVEVDNSHQKTASSSRVDPAARAKAAAAKIAKVLPTTNPVSSVISHGFSSKQGTLSGNHERDSAAELQKLRTNQIYKSVQEQMGQIRALLRNPNESGGKTFMPAPLLLDEQGRQIDESGNVINENIAPTIATLKANKASTRIAQNPYLVFRNIDKEDKLDYLDPRLKVRKRETRAEKTFNFVKQGTFVKQAEQVRAREAKTMLAGFTSGRNPRAYKKESIVAIDEEKSDVANKTDGETQPELAIPENLDVAVPLKPDSNTPDIEWWDVAYLPKEKKVMVDKFGLVKAKCRKENPDLTVDYHEMRLKYCGTMNVIEHPSKLNLLRRHNKTIALPLMLTASERKKIRRKNRAEREKEKQDKIALGLLPPPEPKVKLSNMMRVLSEQAVADPSAIEKKVRQQVAQREKNHEMRNLARKLTPEERREKKLRKIKQDAAGDIHVALFRVPDLSNPQHRFKVDVNAQQSHLTGGVLLCKEDDINVVIVEGGKKAVRHYTHLMTRRIRWNDTADDENSDGDDNDSPVKSNGCVFVWEGIVARRAFNTFRFQECRTRTTARKVMDTKNVGNYWDLIENSIN